MDLRLGIIDWTAIAAVATLLAVLVAMFGPYLRVWLQRPLLRIEYEDKAPFRRDDELERRIRIRLANEGKTAAEGCVVRVTEMRLRKVWVPDPSTVSDPLTARYVLTDYQGDESPDVGGAVGFDFDPVAVNWSGSRTAEPRTVAPGEHVYVDVFKLLRVNEGLPVLQHMEIATAEHESKKQPNAYRSACYAARLTAYAANASPKSIWLEMELMDDIPDTVVRLKSP